MNFRLSLTLASLLIACFAPALCAADDRSPEVVVREATTASNQGRYEEFARAMHPDAIRQFKNAMISLIDAADKDGKANQILRLFPKLKTVEEFKKRDPNLFFADYLSGVINLQPELKKMLSGAQVTTIGHVDESKNLTHVLYRMKAKVEGEPLELGPLVVTLKKDGDRWAMLLNGDVETMMVMMIQAATKKGKVPPTDPKKSKVEPIGHLIEGDQALLLYRVVSPIGDTSLAKLNVQAFNKTEPEGKIVTEGNREAIIKLIREKSNL